MEEISGELKTPDIGLHGRPEQEKIWETYQNHPIFSEVSLVSIQAIHEYLALLWHQYQDASRPMKTKILDEIEKNVKMHRKAAIRLMNKPEEPQFRRGKGESINSYTEKSKTLLKSLWQDIGRMGAVRTKAAIPSWIKKWEKPDMDDLSRFELLAMSESTIERTLRKPKADFRRRLNSGTKPAGNRMKTLIPIRDLEFQPQEPGHCEIDCVAHCGGSLSGEFIWTLTLTDIKTGHTECEALLRKNGFEVQRALHRIEERVPFKIIALYMDNGSEFLNQDVCKRFSQKKMQIDRKDIIKLFRSRPYKKNDQCFVEQKNYTHVRELFGYDRFSGKLMVQLMNNIYRNEWSQLTNFFYPQIRLKSKERIGSKVIRKFNKPKTPFELLKQYLPQEQADQLEAKAQESNPFTLTKKLKRKLREFAGYNSRSAERLGKYAA